MVNRNKQTTFILSVIPLSLVAPYSYESGLRDNHIDKVIDPSFEFHNHFYSFKEVYATTCTYLQSVIMQGNGVVEAHKFVKQ